MLEGMGRITREVGGYNGWFWVALVGKRPERTLNH